MSPHSTRVFSVLEEGNLGNSNPTSKQSIRPAIVIALNVAISSRNETQTNPYVLS